MHLALAADPRFPVAAAVPLGRPPVPRFSVHRQDDPERDAVERYIHGVYRRRYGADVPAFAPVLVSLRDAGGIVAAAGYRDAADAPLFLEHYLEQPVEALLAAVRAGAAGRHGIAEVAHLSAHKAGEGRRLILEIGQHLADEGFAWVATTVTRELLHLFVRLGLTPLMLGAADPRALGPAAGAWGSYYRHAPTVVCGQLDLALRQMQRRAAHAAPSGGPP